MADGPANEAPYRLIVDVDFGERVIVQPFTNLYGCRIGDDTRVGPFVEIQRGASIGARCKIQSHTFVCDGVEIGDEVFVGHGVVFINDKTPRATTDDGRLQSEQDWTLQRTDGRLAELDRLRRRDPRRRADRRGRARRGRRRGHSRRRARRRGRRQSRAGAGCR